MSKQKFFNPDNPRQTIPVRKPATRTAGQQKRILERQTAKRLEKLSKPKGFDRVALAETTRQRRAQVSDSRRERMDRSKLIAKLRKEGDIAGVNRLLAQQRSGKRESDTLAQQTATEARAFQRGVGDIPVEQQEQNFASLNKQRGAIIAKQNEDLIQQIKATDDPDEKLALRQRLTQGIERLKQDMPFTPRRPRTSRPVDLAAGERILERQGRAAVGGELARQRFLTDATVESAGLETRRQIAQSEMSEAQLAAQLGEATGETRLQTGITAANVAKARADAELQQAQSEFEQFPEDDAARRKVIEAQRNAEIATKRFEEESALFESQRLGASREDQLRIDEIERKRKLDEAGGIMREDQGLSIIESEAQQAGFDVSDDIGFADFFENVDSVAEDLQSIRGEKPSDEVDSILESVESRVSNALRTIPRNKRAGYATLVLKKLQESIVNEHDVSSPRFKARPSILPLPLQGFGSVFGRKKGETASETRRRMTTKDETEAYRRIISMLQAAAKEG